MCIQTYLGMYIHRHTHTYIGTYIGTYILRYMCVRVSIFSGLKFLFYMLLQPGTIFLTTYGLQGPHTDF
jgi:hypothetical protein